MDVVIFQPELGVGGAERVILRLAKKFNPVIYAIKYEKAESYPEFREFDIRIMQGSILEAPVSLFASLDSDERMKLNATAGLRFLGAKIKDNYDVLNPHLMPSEWIAARNERVCWYCHSPCRPAYGWEDSYVSGRNAAGQAVMKTAIASYRLVEAQVVPKIEKICTNSEFSRQNIRKHLGRGDAEVVYPAVDLQDFECSDYQKFFFYPSRIVPEKRLEYAIEAFRIFSKREKSGWRLVIGGHLAPTKRNLQYLEEVKSQVAGLAVSFRLNLGGQGLAQLYSDCGATLFCAEREDFGLVPLESMASGKPCISVNEGGPRESIIDGKTGFLINSQQEMAERMLQLAGDRSLAEKMGKAGRKRVGQSYTWEIFLDKMGKAFKGAARGKTN